MGPAVAMVPIEIARYWEELILRARVGNVADESVDVVLVGGNPRWIEVADHGSTVYEVAIMEMVVVVICVAEVSP
jgi:hypothetical protein